MGCVLASLRVQDSPQSRRETHVSDGGVSHVGGIAQCTDLLVYKRHTQRINGPARQRSNGDLKRRVGSRRLLR